MTHERDRDRDDFEARTRAAFERSVADLDGPTRSKLTQARHRALRELEHPIIARHWFAWRPQAAAAALIVVTVAAAWLLIDTQAPLAPVDTIAEVDDFELLLEEDFELIEELEFYAWLEEQPEFSGDDGAG